MGQHLGGLAAQHQAGEALAAVRSHDHQVDAVLGSRVFEHLFRLPLRYFEQRPTGTLVARVQGVETIRDFLSGAAVTLLLDIPFLAIFLAIMLYYSVPLTLIALARGRGFGGLGGFGIRYLRFLGGFFNSFWWHDGRGSW